MKTANRFLLWSSFCTFALLASACSNKTVVTDDTGGDSEEVTENNTGDDFRTNSQELYFADAVTIAFPDGNTGEDDDDDEAQEQETIITNAFEGRGVMVTRNGDHIVITSTLTDTEVNYVLSGKTADGSVKIYSDHRFSLILNGVSIICDEGPALNIQSDKRISVQLVDGTNNRLIDAREYTVDNGTEEMKAALYSQGELLFSGEGSLLVTGNNRHAICSDQHIRIDQGAITVDGAAGNGLQAGDFIRIDGGSLDITADGNGIECRQGYVRINGGTVLVASQGEGITAYYSGSDTSIDPYIEINGGLVRVSTGGTQAHGLQSNSRITVGDCDSLVVRTTGSAAQGLNSTGNITLSGGNIDILTSGDGYYDTDIDELSSSACIRSGGDLSIVRGSVYLVSTGKGGKGINVTGELTIHDGEVTVMTTGEEYVYGRDNTPATAVRSREDLTIHNGELYIKTSGTGAEGLDSRAAVEIHDGTVEVITYHTGIHATDRIAVHGGEIYCYSTTNDGINSRGPVDITGGTVVSSGATTDYAGIRCSSNPLSITGGRVVAIGGINTTPDARTSTRRSVQYTGSGNIHQLLCIRDDHTEAQALLYLIPRTYTQMNLLLSSPDLDPNTRYTVYTGGSVYAHAQEWNGLYTDEVYMPGKAVGSFIPSAMVTQAGDSQ